MYLKQTAAFKMSQFLLFLLEEEENGPPAVSTKAGKKKTLRFQQERSELAKNGFVTNGSRPERQRGCGAAVVLLRRRAEDTI